jgi:hypothetical protein
MKTSREILLLLGVILAPALALAQTTGTIEGVVLDPSDAPIQGSLVNLIETATSSSRTVQTTASGRYAVPGLPPGVYEVEASFHGFRSAVREGVLLSAGRTVRADFSLQIGDLREVVKVTAEIPAISTSASDWGGSIDRTQLADLPLNGRDLFDLAAQQPGVSIANNNEGAMFNGLGIQPSVNGNRPNQNSFRVDGVYVNDASGSAPASAGGRLLGIEGIQELRLITNPFSAEYGRAASAVFTAVSRAGANDWHGSAYYFLRNSALDARNFFDTPTEKIPALRRNHFGGLISGPIRTDRLFFLVNYEGLREVRSRTQRAVTLTAQARQGILPSGNLAVSPLVKPFLDLYPRPNGRDFGDGTAEFISPAAKISDDHFFATRADFLASSRVRTSMRFSTNTGATESPDEFHFWLLNSDSRFAFLQSETSIVQSPATLHALRFGYSRVRNTENATPPNIPETLTFVRGRPIGTLEVTGLTDLTSQTVGSLPRLHVLQDYQFNYEVTHTRRAHTFRLGAGYDRLGFRQRGDFRASGRYRFSSIQDLLRATPAGGDLMSPGSDTDRLWRQHQYHFFIQDEFRALSNLSVLLGVRYEGYDSPTEASGKIATLRNPLQDTSMTIGGPLFENPSAGNFAPRAALAWDVFGTGGTVVRAGAGMFFDLLTSREVTIAGMRVPPFYNRAFITNPTFPDLLAAAAAATLDNSIDGIAYYVQQPYVLQFRFTAGQQLGRRTSIEAGYSGSRGVHLMGQFGDLNVAQAQTLDDGRLFFPASGPLRNPAFGRIGIRTTDFNSFFHALTLRLERRLATSLQLEANYTWGKAIDESSSSTQTDFDNSDRMPQPYNIRLQRGPADFDVRQTLNATASWLLPSPRRGLERHLLGGWQVHGVVQAQTGFPFNPRVGFDRARMRSGFGDLDQRPSLASATPPVILGDPARYYDPMSFVLPAAGFLGDLGRNTLTGPGLFTLNLGLHKSLWRSERHDVRLRIEAFNATNHPNFDVPSELRLFTSSGGRVGSTGRITTTSTSARQIQLALRWSF